MTEEPERRAAGQAALHAALAKAQGEFPAVPRNRTVTVKTKTGGSYSFAYAPLDTILDAVRPALTSNGLAVSQTFRGENLLTLLLHADGGMLESVLPFPRAGLGWQEFGSAVTYARRYALVALLGIASEEDDDGNSADGNIARDKDITRDKTQHEKDVGAIQAIRRKLTDAGLTDEQWRAQLDALYGTTHVYELTDVQAHELVIKLRDAEKQISK